MTVRYVGAGGNNSNDGLTWATRKLTLNGVEDTPVVAGDVIYVGAGVYRELLTVDVSGSLLVTGSASVVAFVTQGSHEVIVSGTNLVSAGVGTDDVFQTPVLASGVDGVTVNITGTSHAFTSAAGNFQQGHVGYTIRINTIGAYIIRTVSSPTSITVAKPDNSSFGMVAGTGLNYNVGPESPYDVLSVTSSSQLTLTKPWGAASFNGLQFIVHKPIRYIGDYTGQFTDGVGGVVRVSGSDNDQTATRSNCISITSKNYRTFRDFQTENAVQNHVAISSSTNIIIEDFYLTGIGNGVNISGASQSTCTIRRCFCGNGVFTVFTHTSTVDNARHIVENSIVSMSSNQAESIQSSRVGGITCRNILVSSVNRAFRVTTAITVGQAMTVNNCIAVNGLEAFRGTVTGEILEDYNCVFNNSTARVNTATGANSNTYPPLFEARWFFQTVYAGAGPYSALQFVSPFDLSAQSQLINLTGTNPASADMRGTAIQNTQREWGALEYDSTLSIKARQAGLIGDGGMIIS